MKWWLDSYCDFFRVRGSFKAIAFEAKQFYNKNDTKQPPFQRGHFHGVGRSTCPPPQKKKKGKQQLESKRKQKPAANRPRVLLHGAHHPTPEPLSVVQPHHPQPRHEHMSESPGASRKFREWFVRLHFVPLLVPPKWMRRNKPRVRTLFCGNGSGQGALSSMFAIF